MKNLVLLFAFVFVSVNMYSQDGKTSCNSLNPATHGPVAASANVLKPDNTYRSGNYYTPGMTQLNIFDRTFVPAGKIYPDKQTRPAFDMLRSIVTPASDENWNLWDSVHIDSYIPSGAKMGVKVDLQKRKLEIVTPYIFCEEAKSAIKRSPSWLRYELESTLARLSQAKQKIFADLINNAEDKYVDEIAFSIAYSSFAFLSSSYCNPQLFADNARLIYEHDKDLPYVEVVDYGSPATEDGNYYSTVKYWRSDSLGNKSQVEVPKEIYYFYIVHPKLSDEIPAYVNPDKEETSSHTSNLAAPTAGGVFWRDYLYTHTEPVPDTTGLIFPVLKDSISKCEVLWDDANKSPMAIRAITKWIQDVMEFGSGSERPHQPVRIYDLHLGRCGEHEDITNAAARACLIPSRGIDAMSSDHVWNEFWDEQWWQWEPVNNSHKEALVYEKGWGKKFGSISARRSDGVTIPVTDRYSEKPCTLVVTILDKNNKPVDGAFILLAASGTLDESSILVDSYGITGNDGKFKFTVSAERNYYARTDTKIGGYPAASNQVASFAPDGGFQAGQTYEFSLKLTGAMPATGCAGALDADTSAREYMIKTNFSTKGDITNWRVNLDDLSGGTTYGETGYNYGETGKCSINLFVTDQANYDKSLTSGKNFLALKSITNSAGEQASVILPKQPAWYAWLDNATSLNNYTHVEASFALYLSPYVGVKESDVSSSSVQLMQNTPNPFNSATNIRFALSEPSFVKLYVINCTGSIVRELYSGRLENKEFSVDWDGNNSMGELVESGNYFYVLDTGSDRIVRKMILVR